MDAPSMRTQRIWCEWRQVTQGGAPEGVPVLPYEGQSVRHLYVRTMVYDTKEFLLMMLVYQVMISKSMVIIRFFLRRSQITLYIFNHRRNIVSAFLQFMRGLLTTPNLTFLHYKYVIAIYPNVGMSLYIYNTNLNFYEVINIFVLSYAFQTHRTMFILCRANHVLSYDVRTHKIIFVLKLYNYR